MRAGLQSGLRERGSKLDNESSLSRSILTSLILRNDKDGGNWGNCAPHFSGVFTPDAKILEAVIRSAKDGARNWLIADLQQFSAGSRPSEAHPPNEQWESSAKPLRRYHPLVRL